jgi:uncharacterized protein YutE (UPF0331/DUF86 family)
VTVDLTLVTRKLLLIAADLDPLRTIHAKGRDRFLAGRFDQAVVERLLERTITRMIDVNYHLITASGHPPPPDYHISFMKLRELEVLDDAFATRIARAAGLRNRLVHDYEDIDAGKVYDALGASLADVPDYLARINRALTRST